MRTGVSQYLATIDPATGLLYDDPALDPQPFPFMAKSQTPFPSLLEACRAMPRDDAAWRELLIRFDRGVAGLALHYLRPFQGVFPDVHEEALEVSMNTWMRLCQHDNRALRNFQGENEGAFMAYLAKLTRNLALDHVRRATAGRRPQFEDPGEAPVEAQEPRPAGAAFEDRDLREAVTAGLLRTGEGKPAQYRNTVICQLAWFEELSAERIAGIGALGLSRGGVEKVVAKGLDGVRKVLNPNTLAALEQETGHES